MTTLIGVKTHFSMGESIMDPSDIIDQAVERGYATIAVTDTNSVNAIPMLTVEGRKKGVAVIAGLSIRVSQSLTWRKPKKNEPKTKNPFWYASLYAMNLQGFKDMMALLSLANDEAHFYFAPQISLDDLLATYAQGNVVVSTGTLYSALAYDDAQDTLNALAALDSERLFIDAIPLPTLYARRVSDLAQHYHTHYGIPVVPAMPMIQAEGNEKTRDAMSAILANAPMDAGYLNQAPGDYYMRPVDEYNHLIATHLGSVAHAGLSAFETLCGYRWEKMEVCLPTMSVDPFRELLGLCKLGWARRIGNPVLGFKPDTTQLHQYKDRLAYELAILKKMGFSNYFLLVQRIVDWCRREGIEVGPGRGSVGGSLVAFLIGVTDVDPIRFGLIFERFINPDRLDLPDIDLDFMSSRRDEVIKELILQYGEDRVAGISNYNTLGSASSLRGVAKAFGLAEIDYRCSKLIPAEHGQPVSLEDALPQVPEIEAFATKFPEVWAQAVKLQGGLRAMGQHAAGVIVAGEPVAQRAVMERRKDTRVVNWDKRLVEDFGLIKLDILGLSTLDIFAHTKRYIAERHGVQVVLEQVALDDPTVMAAFGRGDTVGVFQFESGGIRNLLRQLAEEEPLTFEDVTAATALYRPGPMEAGLMDQYVSIKQKNDYPRYPHPSVEPALRETHSVIVYQEQVMKVARDLAGFTMIESDYLRKAMGKKDPVAMKAQRDAFVNGAVETSGLDADVAGRLFDQIEQFAGYAFNKSHATAYSIISYWAMWLKINYPAEFFAAALTISDEDKRKSLIKDAEKHSVRVVAVDINRSTNRFEIEVSGEEYLLYPPFQALKGLSEKTTAAIMAAKAEKGGPFVDQADFVATVNRRSCNVRMQKVLEDVGAFASIEPSQTPANHPDRVKMQKQLLPGLVSATVKADRKIDVSPYVQGEIMKVVDACQTCGACDLAGKPHPVPHLGRSAKIVIVTDAVNWTEEANGKMGLGDGCEPLKRAIKHAGLTMRDVYITSLVKSRVKSGDINNQMIIGCAPHLDKEIELLRPPVIVAMGSRAARHLCPDLKGGWEELLGKDVYDPVRDATILVGMNPMMVVMDASKQVHLDRIMREAVEVID